MVTPDLSNPLLNDTEARFGSLIDNVEIVKNQINSSQFPFRSELFRLVYDYGDMATELNKIFKGKIGSSDLSGEKILKLNEMIDKLQFEWGIIFELTAIADLIGFQFATGKYSWVLPLVDIAKRDLGLSDLRAVVIPRVSGQFSLTSFLYTTELVILNIPFTALNAPWEWSVIWHEIAGYKVKQIKKNQIGAFKNILPKRQSLKVDKWNVNWVEEVFEDACSVFTFGSDFIDVLTNILKRQPIPSDERHPTSEHREKIARGLLTLKRGEALTGLDDNEHEVCKNLLNFCLENIPSTPLLSNSDSSSVIHGAIKDIMRKYLQARGKVQFSDFENEIDRIKKVKVPASIPNTLNNSRDPKLQTKLIEWAQMDLKKLLDLQLSENDFATISQHSQGGDHNSTKAVSFTAHGKTHTYNHSSHP